MSRIFRTLLILAVALTLLSTAPFTARAEFFTEMGFTAFGNASNDIDNGDLYEAGGMLSVAAPLVEETIRIDFRLEGQVGAFWDYADGTEVALIPALRMYFGKALLQPYIEGGIGPSYNSLDIPELGTNFNFLSYGGAGLRMPLQNNLSLELGYRLRHISNAGLDEANSGVTSNQIQFGISWGF